MGPPRGHQPCRKRPKPEAPPGPRIGVHARIRLGASRPLWLCDELRICARRFDSSRGHSDHPGERGSDASRLAGGSDRGSPSVSRVWPIRSCDAVPAWAVRKTRATVRAMPTAVAQTAARAVHFMQLWTGQNCGCGRWPAKPTASRAGPKRSFTKLRASSSDSKSSMTRQPPVGLGQATWRMPPAGASKSSCFRIRS
jgi:hypothetical protein